MVAAIALIVLVLFLLLLLLCLHSHTRTRPQLASATGCVQVCSPCSKEETKKSKEEMKKTKVEVKKVIYNPLQWWLYRTCYQLEDSGEVSLIQRTLTQGGRLSPSSCGHTSLTWTLS